MKNFLAGVGAIVMLIIAFSAIIWLLQPRLTEWGYMDESGKLVAPVGWLSVIVPTSPKRQRQFVDAPDGRRIYCNFDARPKLQWLPQKTDGSRDWRVVCE